MRCCATSTWRATTLALEYAVADGRTHRYTPDFAIHTTDDRWLLVEAVAANVVAMEQAIARADDPTPMAPGDVRDMHRTLMEGEPERVRPGAFRTEQNWIGGRLNSPLDAAFIPPPGCKQP